MNTVFYEAERIGNVYRGLVIDSKTFDTRAITAHTYPDRTVAIEAARRMQIDTTPEEIAAFVPWSVLEN